MRTVCVAGICVLAYGLPGDQEPNTLGTPCTADECTKPTKKHERIFNTQPGSQWNTHGGFCGSWSIQRATMVKGAWISQQKVRDHTVAAGGHDTEILEGNIDEALKNLKIKGEGFDYKNLPIPQSDAYRKWIKSKLVAGHAIAWMIMTNHGGPGHFPVYPDVPYGFYTHIEPVVGILSDHPLTDEDWYDDDYIVHYTDHNEHAYYRSMSSLPDDTNFTGNCHDVHYSSMPCIYDKYGFGWAVEGFLDEQVGFPASLNVDPWYSEPDYRDGGKAEALTGTLTVDELIEEQKYAIYRWDSVETAFDYSKPRSVHRFIANSTTYIYKDPETFMSDGTIYYRCISDSSASIAV